MYFLQVFDFWIPYSRLPIPSKYQKIIGKLRFSSHALVIETGRYNKKKTEMIENALIKVIN